MAAAAPAAGAPEVSEAEAKEKMQALQAELANDGKNVVTDIDEEKYTDALEALRKLVPDGQDKGELLRFLAANDGDAEKAAKHFDEFLKWRAEKKVDEVDAWIAEQRKLRGDGNASVYEMLFPCTGKPLVDKDGRPFYAERTGLIRATQAGENVDMETFLKFHLFNVERLRRECREQSAKVGRTIVTYTSVLDLQGLSLSTKNVFHFLQEVQRVDARYYPGMMGRIIVVRAPWITPMLYSVLSGVLPANTKNQVVMLGATWEKDLLKYVDAEQLPEFLGGKRKNADCGVALEHSDEAVAKALLLDASGLELKAHNVGAGSTHAVQVVAAAGQKVVWSFKAADAGYDIGFEVLVKYTDGDKKGKQAVAREKDRSTGHQGSFTADCPCEVTAIWDNSYSYFNSKNILFHFALEK